MVRRLLAAALALPVAAQADPLKLPPTAVVAAPSAEGASPSYAPQPPVDPTARYAGWGMRATIQGQSMDLDSPGGGWAYDPAAGPKDIEAGYDWRKGGADAVLGYGQFDHGAEKTPGGGDNHFDSLRRHDGADGVLGFSFVLHGR